MRTVTVVPVSAMGLAIVDDKTRESERVALASLEAAELLVRDLSAFIASAKARAGA